MGRAIVSTDCDQCNGTGWIGSVRCGCMEADDHAQARRQHMGLEPKLPDAVARFLELQRQIAGITGGSDTTSGEE